ncbi:hypothetical protein [Microlunatus sp. Y2014]|uniref:hypothetical protein n=1 Tax=Microlunatus sp. Y2014 TaxID=3418488 RepID=UPI003DA77FCD
MAAQPVPSALGARHGSDPQTFWPAWTRTEVLAKLADVPILTWVARHGLDDAKNGRAEPANASAGSGSHHIVTARIEDLVISAGAITIS